MGLRKQLYAKRRYLLVVLHFCCLEALAFGGSHHITSIKLHDPQALTSESWVAEFLEITFPTHLTDEDLRLLEQKLLTAQVFTQAHLTPEPDGTLLVSLKEKWTLIPVVRGQFGGGTPLLVLGARDNHSFGRLLSLGAEARQYGNAPFGFVLYAKSPRAFGGNYHLGMEYWQEYRTWGVWDHSESIGEVYVQGQQLRFEWLAPLWAGKLDRVQLGLDVNYKNQGADYRGVLSSPEFRGVLLNSPHKKSYEIWPTFVYDNLLVISPTGFSGQRLVAKWGLILREQESLQQALEVKLHVYQPIGDRFVLASQSFLGIKDSPYYTEQYLLGGFDTVRGMPDGDIFGSTTFYANLEGLTRVYSHPVAFVQHALFFDAGTAGNDEAGLIQNQRYSLGMGLRVASPQIQKFMLRVDLARGIGSMNTWGASIGMTAFFHPYPSLSQ